MRGEWGGGDLTPLQGPLLPTVSSAPPLNEPSAWVLTPSHVVPFAVRYSVHIEILNM